jgi:hypothetical protein
MALESGCERVMSEKEREPVTRRQELQRQR